MLRSMVRWIRKIFSSRNKAQGTRITYQLPCPTIFSKYYYKGTLFQDVDWSDWDSVVDGFQSRFVKWYFDPLSIWPQAGHEAYPVLCAICALIDVFTYYTGATEWHDKKQYKHFLRKLNPIFGTNLTFATGAYRDS
jgi:hypothetical protein